MQPDHLKTYWEKEEDENSKKGIIGSICFHSILLLIFLLPWFSSIDPPPGPEGVLISLGNPTFSDSEEPSPAKSSEPLAYNNEEAEQEAKESEPLEESPPKAEPEEDIQPAKEVQAKEAPAKEVPAKFIKTVENTQEESPIKIKEDKEKKEEKLREEIKRKNAIAEKEAKEKAKAAAERKRAEQQELEEKKLAEAEAKRRTEEEAKKKAEAQRKRVEEAAKRKREEEQKKQEAYAKTKSELGNLFDGNGDSAESQGKKGDPDGSNDSKILDGLSGGLGAVGGGLSGRGIIFEPKIVENSQKTGKVVVKVCVDQSGDVISAKYTQRGSTTTDSELVKVAEEAANKYRFTEGDLAEQCGTITIDFKLK